MSSRNASLLVLMLILGTSLGQASSFVYANNATGGSPYVYKIDKNTGAILNTYSNLSGQNGRGVVVVGNTMYYTTASENQVFSYDLSTNTNNGALFSVAGATALSTIAFDGTNFWVGDYSGTNNAFLYTPTGTLLKTVSLANCTEYCDGLEYLAAHGGELLSNRADSDGPIYDLYDTNGNLLQASFINAGANGCDQATGIAFDGTLFFVSCNFNMLATFDATGNYVGTISVTGGSPLMEDLSADYAQVLPPKAPEPSSLLLLGSGLAGIACVIRRKLRA